MFRGVEHSYHNCTELGLNYQTGEPNKILVWYEKNTDEIDRTMKN